MSYYCGSAGCEVEAVVSQPRGYKRIHLGNVRGLEIDRSESLALLRMSLHGSSCGRFGAAECNKVFRWGQTDFVQIVDPRPKEPTVMTVSAIWQTQPLKNGSAMAILKDDAPVKQISFSCADNLYTTIIETTAKLGNAPTDLTFTGTKGGSVTANAAPVQGNPGYWLIQSSSNQLATLFAGADSALSVKKGGVAVGNISLNGSSRAISTALQPCGGVPASGNVATKPADGSMVTNIPIYQGYYVRDDELCSEPQRVVRIDANGHRVVEQGSGGYTTKWLRVKQGELNDWGRKKGDISYKKNNYTGYYMGEGPDGPEEVPFFVTVLANDRVSLDDVDAGDLVQKVYRLCQKSEIPRAMQ